MLTKVFLKGKFAEQLNSHLQSQGEALTWQTPPHPPGLSLVSRPHLEWSVLTRLTRPQRRSWQGNYVPMVLWAHLAMPQRAAGTRAWCSTGAGLVQRGGGCVCQGCPTKV